MKCPKCKGPMRQHVIALDDIWDICLICGKSQPHVPAEEEIAMEKQAPNQAGGGGPSTPKAAPAVPAAAPEPSITLVFTGYNLDVLEKLQTYSAKDGVNLEDDVAALIDYYLQTYGGCHEKQGH